MRALEADLCDPQDMGLGLTEVSHPGGPEQNLERSTAPKLAHVASAAIAIDSSDFPRTVTRTVKTLPDVAMGVLPSEGTG